MGSSSQLALRFSGYLYYTYKPIGKFIPLLLKDRLSKFTLEVIPLVNNYNFRSEIVLEQYYLLDPSFNLNTVKVANNPSGSNAKTTNLSNNLIRNNNSHKGGMIGACLPCSLISYTVLNVFKNRLFNKNG